MINHVKIYFTEQTHFSILNSQNITAIFHIRCIFLTELQIWTDKRWMDTKGSFDFVVGTNAEAIVIYSRVFLQSETSKDGYKSVLKNIKMQTFYLDHITTRI